MALHGRRVEHQAFTMGTCASLCALVIGWLLLLETCVSWLACFLGPRSRTKLGCLASDLGAAPPLSKDGFSPACVVTLPRSSWSSFGRALKHSVLVLLEASASELAVVRMH